MKTYHYIFAFVLFIFFTSCRDELAEPVKQGVKAFIIRIAYMIPSGYSPIILISMIRLPTPIPNTNMPFVVKGAVTGSVAIKNAQNSIPPPVICSHG